MSSGVEELLDQKPRRRQEASDVAAERHDSDRAVALTRLLRIVEPALHELVARTGDEEVAEEEPDRDRDVHAEEQLLAVLELHHPSGLTDCSATQLEPERETDVSAHAEHHDLPVDPRTIPVADADEVDDEHAAHEDGRSCHAFSPCRGPRGILCPWENLRCTTGTS